MLVFITGMEILLQPLPSKGKQLAFALARVRLGVTSRERRGLYPLYTRNPFLSWKEGFAFVSKLVFRRHEPSLGPAARGAVSARTCRLCFWTAFL